MEVALQFCKQFLLKQMNSSGIIRSEQIMYQNYCVDDKTKERLVIQFQAFQKLVRWRNKDVIDEKIILAQSIALISALTQPAYWKEVATDIVGDVDQFMDVYIEHLKVYFQVTDFGGYDGHFTPANLWFILYLLVISVVTLPILLWYKNSGKKLMRSI